MDSKKIVVQINSGLGNQMFQYAFGKAIEKDLQKKVYFDVLSDFDNPSYRKLEIEPFDINLSKASLFLLMRFKPIRSLYFHLDNYFFFKSLCIKLTRKYLNSICYKLLVRIFKPIIITEHEIDNSFTFFQNLDYKNIYIQGYFQNEYYAESVENELRIQFKLKIDYLTHTENAIKIKNNNSVSIHIRRGDYLEHTIFTVLPINYYLNAIEFIKSKISMPVFFIFSDDINWAKDNLYNLSENIVFMDVKYSNNACDDMLMMSYCKHNIIANSTYSWWGAWLNNNSDKIVIAPSTWYNESALNNQVIKNLLPQKWIIL